MSENERWGESVAWDFSTEPEFQEQLDWVEHFCRTEIEPLDLVFPGAAWSRNPKAKALADPLKQQVKDRGLWALFLDEDLGGPGFGQLKLALLNEVLWTAWTIDNSSTQAARTQIAACKYTCAKVLREVTYRALHVMGSLGTTNLTPLQAMWASAPTMAIADGVDEVHKVTVARNVLKDYEPHEGLWPTEYLPAKREEARKKFADLLAADPDLAAWADKAQRAMTRG